MPISSPQDFKQKASAKRKTKDVEVEGVGTVRLRALSAGDAQAFQSEVKRAGENAEDLAFTLIARSWIAEDGSPWMPEAEGVAFARELDPAIYADLAKEVLALNGLQEQAVEDAEKNSDASRGDSTPTGSPES